MGVWYNGICELLLLSRNWNFHRVRIVAKSADYLCHVCPHILGRLPLHGFTWNLILGTFMKICRANPKLVKIGQQYRVPFFLNNQPTHQLSKFILL